MEQKNAQTERKIKDNYYLLLDLSLDPPVTNKEEIKKALDAKKRQWIDGSSRGIQQLKCKLYIENFQEIEGALLGGESRSFTSAFFGNTKPNQLRNIIEEAREIKLSELEQLLAAISKAGRITNSQIKYLLKVFNCFSERTIRSKINVPIVEDSKVVIFRVPPKPNAQLMSDLNMDAFNRFLEILNKKDISDFLDCPKTASLDALKQKAMSKLDEIRTSVRKDVEITAIKDLAGMIYAFEEKDLRAYFAALKYYRVEKELKNVFKCRCIDKTIDWNSFQYSIDESIEKGLSEEEAKWFVYDWFIIKHKCYPFFTISQGNNE